MGIWLWACSVAFCASQIFVIQVPLLASIPNSVFSRRYIYICGCWDGLYVHHDSSLCIWQTCFEECLWTLPLRTNCILDTELRFWLSLVVSWSIFPSRLGIILHLQHIRHLVIVQSRWQHFAVSWYKCFHTWSSSADVENWNWGERVSMSSSCQHLSLVQSGSCPGCQKASMLVYFVSLYSDVWGGASFL